MVSGSLNAARFILRSMVPDQRRFGRSSATAWVLPEKAAELGEDPCLRN
jgi:hypothetical protein